MSTHAPPPAAPPPAAPPRPSAEPARSGTAFVLLAALGALGFVAFLAFASPILRERTEAAAPPPAPLRIGSGEIGAEPWTATAVAAGPDEPCLDVAIGSRPTERLCTGPRGGPIRAVAASEAGGDVLLYGIVDARTVEVRVERAGGEPLLVDARPVDFGFPLSFFAVALPEGSEATALRALDRDGEQRARASCRQDATLPVCDVVVDEEG